MANISTIQVGSTSYGLTPASHASTATTYGAATASNYGHVKLSDNYTSSAGAAASGIGASSLAVYNTYNTLNRNKLGVKTASSITFTITGVTFHGMTSSSTPTWYWTLPHTLMYFYTVPYGYGASSSSGMIGAFQYKGTSATITQFSSLLGAGNTLCGPFMINKGSSCTSNGVLNVSLYSYQNYGAPTTWIFDPTYITVN